MEHHRAHKVFTNQSPTTTLAAALNAPVTCDQRLLVSFWLVNAHVNRRIENGVPRLSNRHSDGLLRIIDILRIEGDYIICNASHGVPAAEDTGTLSYSDTGRQQFE